MSPAKPLSVTNGELRTWPGLDVGGDYLDGGFFYWNGPNYDAQWVEPEGIRANIVQIREFSLETGLAIDPMYLILSGGAYLRWVEQHHPHELKVAEIEAVLHSMTPEEQNAALKRAKTLAEYGRAVQEAIAAIRK